MWSADENACKVMQADNEPKKRLQSDVNVLAIY